MWLARSLSPLRSHLLRPASARGGRSILQLRGSSPPASTSASDDRFNRDPAHNTSAAAGSWPLANRPDFCNGCGSNQLLQRQRHLYLVLDDWENGFSLHKLSLNDLLSGGDAVGGELRRLPDPIFRLVFLTVGTEPSFHALGSNIVVRTDSNRLGGLTLIYDTATAALDMCSSLEQHLHCTYHATAAGDKLFTFDFDSSKGLYLGPAPSTISGEVPYCWRPPRRWIWERIPVPPPFTRYSDSDGYISATALHPDGRTIFVSVRSDFAQEHKGSEQERERKLQLGTFSLDTESGEWTRRGDWYMPFEGQAHYDGELGAWVGTNTVYNKEDQNHHEHLFSCDVPDLGKGSTDQAPAWKVATEKLTFLKASLSSTYQPVLLSTGDGMFCLIEPTIREWVGFPRCRRDGDKWQLHVTMFRVKYGKNGELVVVPVLPGRSYLIYRYLADFMVPAFWM